MGRVADRLAEAARMAQVPSPELMQHQPAPFTAGDPSVALAGRGVILVPRRTGFADRDRLWAWTRAWWERHLSKLPVIEGHHDVGLFNRSAAINKAAALAGSWDTAVIIDADVICDPTRVLAAMEVAQETGRMTLPFTVRKDLDRVGTERVLSGDTGPWERYVHKRYTDGCSSVVVVSRRLWDEVGGFDPAFQGWGWEDNAFHAACVTFSGASMVTLPGEVWHLWHRTAKDGQRGKPSWAANQARAERYRTLTGDREATRELQAEGRQVAPYDGPGIPKILHRVVPEVTTPEVEGWWARWQELHPDWRALTHRDPLDPTEWPLTSPFWQHCRHGAQLADLVRLEALLRWGGVYVDSDVEPYRALDPLCGVEAFAAWEDNQRVPNAVLGSKAGHPAIQAALDLAILRVQTRGGADISWATGPGVITEKLTDRPDVLLLPPGSFYPYHYTEKKRRGEDHQATQPWAFGAHHWAASWLPEDKR